MITAKLTINAGKVTPNSTINPLLGQNGIPVDAFCKQATEEVKVYEDGVPVRLRVRKKNSNLGATGQTANKQPNTGPKQGSSTFELHIDGPVCRYLVELCQLSLSTEQQSLEDPAGSAAHSVFAVQAKDTTGSFSMAEKLIAGSAEEAQQVITFHEFLRARKGIKVVTLEQLYAIAVCLAQIRKVSLSGSVDVVAMACQLLSRAHALGVKIIITDVGNITV